MISVSASLTNARDIVLDLIFPQNIYCISCDRPIDIRFPYSLCPACTKKISWANGNCCPVCGKSIDEDKELCHDCEQVERDFDSGVTVSGYDWVERELIYDFKFRDKSYMRLELALLMWEKIQTEGLEFDCVIAVPMHKNKLKKRGYNQAELLAGEIARLSGKIHYSEAMVRTEDTQALSGLDFHMRKVTVENVFKVSEWVKKSIGDKDILLVDDILTTGSTASACSRALKEAKGKKVYVVSFASGTIKG